MLAAGLRKTRRRPGSRCARAARAHRKGVFDLDDAGKLPYESPVMEVVELDGFDLRPGPLEEFLADGLAAAMTAGDAEGRLR